MTRTPRRPAPDDAPDSAPAVPPAPPLPQSGGAYVVEDGALKPAPAEASPDPIAEEA